MLAKATHPSVPSSASPPPSEFGRPYWYVMRSWALRARADLSDDDARKLVNSFEALDVTLPCPECQQHFREDWASDPFTLAHARDLNKAVQWVELLKAKIDARVKSKSAPVAAETRSVSKKPVRVVPLPVAHARPASAFVRTLPAAQARAAQGLARPLHSARGPATVTAASAEALATRAAVIRTAAQRSGRSSGCGCGR